MKIIYHLEFAKTGLWMSGWEKNLIENAKFFISKWEKNIILTTDNGKKTYINAWLKESAHLEYKVIYSYEYESKSHIFLSYLFRLRQIKRLLSEINFNNKDIIICHSDFFPNSLAIYSIFRKNKNLIFFFWFHMLAPSIFKWYEWEFTWRFQVPRINVIHYKLNQILYFIIIRIIKHGLVISINPYYKEYLSRKNVKFYILKFFWWRDINSNIDIEDRVKKYDVCFMWRFHVQKGILEIPKIVFEIKKYIPSIKILIIWWWNLEIEEQLRGYINNFWLTENIDLVWTVIWDERYKLLSQSKIFLFPSYFESYWLVIIEAMSIWLPVITYDLPVFKFFTKWIIKVPTLNNWDMCKEIINLLNNTEYYLKSSRDALNFSKNYSWERTWSEIYSIITNMD